MEWAWQLGAMVKERFEKARSKRRWAQLRRLGMGIGKNVYLPDSLWIDNSHCFLISIGDNCGFGEGCAILAHDAQMREFVHATRIGRVLIRESCHIGAHTLILPGVEIGPRTIVGAKSIVSRSLPPNSVCAGHPAKVIDSLDNYLSKHRANLANRPRFPVSKYDINFLTPERRAELLAAVAEGDAYMTNPRRAERILSRVPISVSVGSESQLVELKGSTVDLSHLGLRMETHIATLAPGQIVGVIRNGDAGRPIRSRVVWTSQKRAGQVEAGVEFLCPAGEWPG